MAAIQSVDINNRALNMVFDDATSIIFEDYWLRDHCRCSKCYHSDTSQRANHLLDIPDVTIDSVQYDKSEMIITWSDNHESVYKADFLVNFDYKTWASKRRMMPSLWKGEEVAKKVAKVNVDNFLNSVEGAEAVFKSLLDYGVAIIEGVDVSMEATEKVCKSLGGVQHTLFGGMWSVAIGKDHADTAYTGLPLAVHNDNTYFTEAAGLQIFHCLEHSNGTGGETILVDGFYGASQLRTDFPEDYEFLCNFDVEAEYIEDNYHFRYSAPVIQVDKLQNLKQIRFNVYDRSAMAFPKREECRAYYRSLRNLSRYYQNTEYQWKLKLIPGNETANDFVNDGIIKENLYGSVLVFDNFRVLHGRAGFTGKRVLCGSYVSRSDWLSKARTLGLSV